MINILINLDPISWARQTLCRALPFTLLLISSQLVFGQGYARITGVVTDTSGAAVKGATITVMQVGTGEIAATTTNDEGLFVFPTLRPANYELKATSPGFSTFTKTGIVLQADSAVTVNVGLQVGNIDQTVTVEAASAQVDTTTATLSQVVDQRRINELPLNGRNAAALTTLVAGVAIAPNAQADQGITKTFPVAVTVTANGSRANQSNYMLDGGSNLDVYTNVNAPFPFPDALQEFSVQTSNYNAEYGQNAGGVVNIVTKSGARDFHGDIFEYNRNAIFNASNVFSNPSGATDPLKRNQFGGTIGGPVKIPGLSHAYFFGGYQKTILRNSPLADTAAIVPTQAQLNGQFAVANSNQCIKNPFTGALYPCSATATSPGFSTIDPATFDPAAVALTKYLPDGGTSGSVTFRRPTRQNYDELVTRYDQEIREKDKLSGRYYYNKFYNGGVLDLTNLLTYADQAQITYHDALISETHTFSDRLLNNFSLSYGQINAARGPLDGGISVNDLGVKIWNPDFKQINQIQVSPGFSIGDNPAATFKRNNWSLKDDIRWVKGNHNLAFGFQGEYSRVNLSNQFQQPGAFTFNSTDTNNAMASFLLGYLASFNQQSGQFFENHGKFAGFFGQDSWKVNRRLSLNLGLRYEPFFPWHEVRNRMGAFDPEAFAAGQHSTQFPNAPIGLKFPGDPGMLTDGIRSVYSDFMPRLGFALDVFGDGKLSVRGGAGVFYDTRISSVFNNIYSNGSPYVTRVGLNFPGRGTGATFSNPYTGSINPFPAPQPPPADAPFPAQPYLTFDPYNEYEPARIYNWNLTVERQLTSASLVRLAYVGSHGSHLWVPVELNYTRLDPNATGSESQRLYAPVYTQPITAADYGGSTSYNSFQATFEQRFHRGLSILGNYTWSKALDNLPPGASVTAIASNVSYVLPAYVPDFRQMDYGPSDFDRRHVVSVSYVWALPKVSQRWGVTSHILNGWQTTGILQLRSGDPISIFSGASDNSKSSQLRDRAVQVLEDAYGPGACGSTLRCVDYLNQAAFSNNALGTYGTTGKGSVRGPGYASWDVSIQRMIGLTERINLEFRAEYFNVLNHPNFLDPATNNQVTYSGVGSSFGRITGAMDPRIGQLSLKLHF